MALWKKYCPAALLMLLFSCGRSVDEPGILTNPIAFEIAVNPNTKSGTEGVEDAAVWVYDGIHLLLDGSSLVRSGMLWLPEGGQRWPSDDAELDFYAACPRPRASFDLESGVMFKGCTIDEGGSLMYAEPVLGRSARSSAGVVSLVFNRAMCLVRFNVAATLQDELTHVLVRRIVLDGVYVEGDFCSLPFPMWRPTGRRSTMTLWEGEMPATESLSMLCESYAIPQNAHVRVALLCDIDSQGMKLENQELECEADVVWKTSKLVEYNLKINSQLKLVFEKNME